ALGVAAGVPTAAFLLDRVDLSALPVTATVSEVVTPLRIAIGTAAGLLVTVAGAAIALIRIASIRPIAAISPHAAHSAGARRTLTHRLRLALVIAAAGGGAGLQAVATRAPGQTTLVAAGLALWLVA